MTRRGEALPDHAAELAEIRNLARLLDSRWRIPLTQIRFGIDPVLGLVPGAGDLVAGVVSTYVIVKAHRLGAPKTLLARMAGNVALDTVFGAIPLVGSVFDVFYKASTRNLGLLADHLERTGAEVTADLDSTTIR
ncbi:DUF4112 domain-containing protein [Mesorhizobium sp. CAU 1741]|uniref:DUF4112 domain-containing protein n=1 Tax=Mesorhizobium sp. CAU 1741 TaxID=3140366 RepID=UPI00325AF21F